MSDTIEVTFENKVDFFEENNREINKLVFNDPFIKNTLADFYEFMAYAGIEKITLGFKTKEDEEKYLSNLKTREVKA